MLPERIEEVRDWLSRARLDVRAAERLLADDCELAGPALFHCQQAVEKAMKAYLVWHDRPYSKTHNLVALLHLCAEVEPSLLTLTEAAIILTPYAVAFRYPGEFAGPTAEQAVEALQAMHQMFAIISDRLPPDSTDT